MCFTKSSFNADCSGWTSVKLSEENMDDMEVKGTKKERSSRVAQIRDSAIVDDVFEVLVTLVDVKRTSNR